MTEKQALEYLFKLTQGYTWYMDDDINIYLNTTKLGFNSLRVTLSDAKLDFTSSINNSLKLYRIEIKFEDVINHKSKIREDKINQILDEE